MNRQSNRKTYTDTHTLMQTDTKTEKRVDGWHGQTNRQTDTRSYQRHATHSLTPHPSLPRLLTHHYSGGVYHVVPPFSSEVAPKGFVHRCSTQIPLVLCVGRECALVRGRVVQCGVVCYSRCSVLHCGVP